MVMSLSVMYYSGKFWIGYSGLASMEFCELRQEVMKAFLTVFDVAKSDLD